MGSHSSPFSDYSGSIQINRFSVVILCLPRSLTHAVTASPGHSAAPALVRAPESFISGCGDRDLNQVLPPGPPPVSMCTSLVSAQVTQ